jgi:hypothetical protein
MQRHSFARYDPDAAVSEEQKQPYEVTSSEHSSKESMAKVEEPMVFELPPHASDDAELNIGEGDIKALDTAEDIVTTVIHVDDDPTLNPWTFRMFFIGKFLIIQSLQGHVTLY